MRSVLLAVLAVGCSSSAGGPGPAAPIVEATPRVGAPVALPAVCIEGRFHVRPRTRDGTVLSFLTDTGGALLIAPRTVERLGLPVTHLDGQTDAVAMPAFAPDAAIPAPAGAVPLLVVPAALESRLDGDGLLGARWFAGRAWTFDYRAGALWQRAPGDLPPHAPSQRVALGFQVGADGRRTTDFPRITVEVAGRPLDLLLDTGATVALSPSALARLRDGRPAWRATSFIAASVFESWRKDHPEWRVLEDADVHDGGHPMIEVPAVTIAGHTVGPVWFTRRGDRNFHDFMSSMMDRRVDGALGGSALQYFRVTVDYTAAVAVFEPG